MIRIEKFGFKWEMQEGFEPLLMEMWNQSGEVIKKSAAKSVIRWRVGEQDYYIKKYHLDAIPGRSLKYYFKPSNAAREWTLAQELEELKVPFVRHEAFGERWSLSGLQESVIVTRGFSGKPLNEIEGWNAASLRKFIDTLHGKGLLQRDLHPANILYDPTEDRFNLVDLDGIEIQPTLSEEEKRNNLAYLRMFVPIPVFEDIQIRSRELSRTVYSKRSKRCLKENREFSQKKINGIYWNIRKPFLNEELRSILKNPNRVLDREARILKPGRSSTVGAVGRFVIKRYHLRRPSRFIKNLFRSSRARRSYRKAYHLELRGIPTARAMACGDHRIGRVLFRSFFIMEEIPGAHPLSDASVDLEDKALQFGELLGRLHDGGFIHRDLKLPNLLFDDKEKLHLIDLEGLEFVGKVSAAQAASNLKRLDRDVSVLKTIETRHRFLFFRRYFQKRGIKPSSFRSADR
ncbi:MAG TPA: hypothetical protein EYQ50_11550 [Verrucomicrobiales bacterium]|nr:hypothetical protein [Verrucomicrobiales bacterium]